MSTPVETSVQIGPIANIVLPVIGAALSAFAVVAVRWLSCWLAAHKLAISAANEAALEAGIEKCAGIAIAGAENNLATGKLNVGSPAVAHAIDMLESHWGDIILATGWTPAKIEAAILGAIGSKQAQMTATDSTPKLIAATVSGPDATAILSPAPSK